MRRGAPAVYAEHEPPAALRPFVQCFWTRAVAAGGSSPPSHRVLPDGCVDLVLTLDGTWAPEDASSPAAPMDGALFVGAMTSALVFRSEPGVAFVGVRCRPGAARALFGIPAEELTDRRLPAHELWHHEDWPRGGAGDPLAALTRLLADRFSRAAPPPRDVRAAVAHIRRSRGRVRIAPLCAQLGVTRQHLARRFAEHVGLSPKMLARVERVREVIRLARTGDAPSWSRIACDAGYADQSHLVSEFGELVGITPRQWLAESASGA